MFHMESKTHAEAVEAFLDAYDSDLTAADYPAISQLRSIAAQLDADSSVSSLHGQYGLTYRDLVKRLEARKMPQSTDPLEELLHT